MKKSSKMLLALGASAIAGAIAGYYLNSDNGRKAQKNAVKNIKETAKEASDRMNEMAEKAKTAIGDVAVQAKGYMNNIIKSADETLAGAMETFDKGKEAAKAKAKSMATNNVEA